MLIKWKLPLLLLIILFYLQYSLWFGNNNASDYQQNKNVVSELSQDNEQLKMRNEQMFAEIADLYEGSDAIEERARNHLGMVKADEHFYRIVTDSSQRESYE